MEIRELPVREQTVQGVVCPDGKRRAFRYHTRTGHNGFVRVQGYNVSGTLIPHATLRGQWAFQPSPGSKNAMIFYRTYQQLPLDHVIRQFVLAMRGHGYDVDEEWLLRTIGLTGKIDPGLHENNEGYTEIGTICYEIEYLDRVSGLPIVLGAQSTLVTIPEVP